MRSGDYPVTNSENVAIIVVLSGLENIPRLTELREIREQYRTGISRHSSSSLDLPPGGSLRTTGGASAITTVWSGSGHRDDMISLPGERPKTKGGYNHPENKSGPGPENPVSIPRPPVVTPAEVSRQQAIRPRILEEGGESHHTASPGSNEFPVKKAVSQRVLPVEPPGTRDEVDRHLPHRKEYGIVSPGQEIRPYLRKTLESRYEGSLPLNPVPVKSRVPPHQVPEQETREETGSRLRESSGNSSAYAPPALTPETKIIIRRVTTKAPVRETAHQGEAGTQVPAKTERTIIRQRKKEPGNVEGLAQRDPVGNKGNLQQEELDLAIEMEDFSAPVPPDERKIGIKDRLRPADDDVFLGKKVSLKEPLRVKDGALLHTEIKTKKYNPVSRENDEFAGRPEGTSPSHGKKARKPPVGDDEGS
jgi:hypothetical protein